MKQKQSHITIFGGGLDLVTPSLQVAEGKLFDVKNYENALNQGYRVMAGYERVDGQSSPTGSPFLALETEVFNGTFVVGETVSGSTSGATGIIVFLGAKGLYLVDVVNTFLTSEEIIGNTSGAITTSSTLVANENVAISGDEAINDVRFAKEIYFRDKIQAVPGIGTVRGVYQHESATLAVRDFDGVEARMYKATSTGWSRITASHTVFFDTRVAAFPIPGTVLNDGNGNNATLHTVSLVIVGGTVGVAVLVGFTEGWELGDLIKDGVTTIATMTTAATLITLKPGGKNEWASHNFTGGVGFYRAYTADGVNPIFEYDPALDIISPIYTDQLNIATDIPTFLAVYQNHLFVGFDRGITRNSEPGDPFLWDAAAGSLEIAVGAQVTGLDAAPSSLIVLTRRTTYSLTGITSADFSLTVASQQTGARAYTAQHIGTTYMLDDRGIIELSRVQAFGNFENATISTLIQPLVTELTPTVVASTIVLTNNIYKLFSSDGRGLSITFQEGQIAGFSFFDLNKNVNVVSNSEDETGKERIYFGGSDGFVYEMERGVSFDGGIKEAWIKTVRQYFRSTTLRKRYYRAFFNVETAGTAELQISADYTDGSLDANPTDIQVDTITGFASTWDVGLWDSAVFDATISADAYIDITGTGDSISMFVYSKSATDDIFTLKDVVFHYKNRRTLRGAR